MHRPRAIPALLFALVWFGCAWFGSWEFNPNNATRLFAAISLVEDGDATIDEFAHLTIDKAQFGNHVYLDKAPGMTLMALPAVALADAVTGERASRFDKWQGDPAFTRFIRLRLRLAVASGPALLTALAAVLLYDLALGLSGRPGGALFASLGYGLGTPVWGWSTTIFGHAAVAALYVVAIWATWRGTRDARARPACALLLGASLGWAIVVEYQAVLAGAAIGLWALARAWQRPERWRIAGVVAAGGAAALLPLVAYNLIAFGTVFRLGYQGVVGFEGMNQGLFGLVAPSAGVLWEIVFGLRRGLLWVAPVLVVAPCGLMLLMRDRGTRGLAIAVCAVVGTVLLVNAAYVYWDGGNSTGPRLSVPMLGVLSLGLAPFHAHLESRIARVVTAAMLALSVAVNLLIASAEIMAPPTLRFPLWSGVWQMRFLAGDLRTVASDWWGWSTWAGFWLYVGLALPAIGWLVHSARLADGRDDR